MKQHIKTHRLELESPIRALEDFSQTHQEFLQHPLINAMASTSTDLHHYSPRTPSTPPRHPTEYSLPTKDSPTTRPSSASANPASPQELAKNIENNPSSPRASHSP